MGLVLVGGRMNANFSIHSSLNYWFSMSTIFLAVNFEHAIFMQSRLLQPAKSQYVNCSKKELIKIALAAVSDPTVYVSLAWRQVLVYTCWPNQNTWWRNNCSWATNRWLAGWMRPGGCLLRTIAIKAWQLKKLPENSIFLELRCLWNLLTKSVTTSLQNALLDNTQKLSDLNFSVELQWTESVRVSWIFCFKCRSTNGWADLL